MKLLQKRKFTESDLYEPVRQWLVNNGFQVQAEVKNCDIISIKNENIYVIELKKNFNLKLVYQCLNRQKYSDYCYAAFPASTKKDFRSSIIDIKLLLNKIGVGLILIHLYDKSSIVEKVLDAKKNNFRSNVKSRSIVKELSKRTGNYNKGGINGEVITAYREQSILIFFLMVKYNLEKPRDIVKKGGPANTSRILRDNHYKWFHKLERGKYTFDVDLDKMKSKYAAVFDYYEQNF